MYQFTRDENKNTLNKKKHNVSFEEALLEYDELHSESEERFRLLGYSIEGNLLLVVHCIREETIIRIISSRKATPTETQMYERSIGL